MEKEINESIEKELRKQYNVCQKTIFRYFLLKTKDDKEAFNKVVMFIGQQWHTLRNLEKSKKVRDAFSEKLRKNFEKIVSGEYEWNKPGNHTYSYESKICFLINPVKYRIINDSQNCFYLYDGKTNTQKIRNEWQKKVDEYYKNKLKFAPKNNETDIKKIFEEDFETWFDGGKKITISQKHT